MSESEASVGQPTALRTRISVKKQEDPVVVSVDDDVMKGVRKAQMHIRNEFRDFLRSTLSVLEEDIVENIVRVYDHHCSQEDDVLTATLLVAKDNVEKKYFPFVFSPDELTDATLSFSQLKPVFYPSLSLSKTRFQIFTLWLNNEP